MEKRKFCRNKKIKRKKKGEKNDDFKLKMYWSRNKLFTESKTTITELGPFQKVQFTQDQFSSG